MLTPPETRRFSPACSLPNLNLNFTQAVARRTAGPPAGRGTPRRGPRLGNVPAVQAAPGPPPAHAHAGRHFLQIPGPTNVPERVLRALAAPTIDHRGPEFAALTRDLLERLP
jgi:hypothetical protein